MAAPIKYNAVSQIALGGYSLNDIVMCDGVMWRSRVNSNLAYPTLGANWKLHG